MVSLVAPAVGAATGGTITFYFSWPWLFLINLVPGLLVTALVLRYVDIDRPQTELLRRTDFIGFVGLAAFLGSLQYVLEEGPRRDWFDTASIRSFAAVSAVGAMLLVWRARRVAEPIVDLRALADRNFVVGCLSSFVIGVMLYGIVFIIPTFLGLVRGYDSLQIGHITMLSGISMFLSAPLAGRLQEAIDPRLLIAYGLGMVAFGDWCNAGLTAQSDFWTFLVPQLIRGHGFTFALVPMTVMTIGTLPPELVKSGSGLYNLMRNLGGAFGIAGIQTSLRDGHAEHFRQLTGALTAARPPVRDALAAAHRFTSQFGSDSPLLALRVAVRAAHREALVLAYNETLLTLAMMMLLPILLLPLARKPVIDLLGQGD
jgi:DHA2 family multidrug resistance protein